MARGTMYHVATYHVKVWQWAHSHWSECTWMASERLRQVVGLGTEPSLIELEWSPQNVLCTFSAGISFWVLYNRAQEVRSRSETEPSSTHLSDPLSKSVSNLHPLHTAVLDVLLWLGFWGSSDCQKIYPWLQWTLIWLLHLVPHGQQTENWPCWPLCAPSCLLQSQWVPAAPWNSGFAGERPG